jgi:hypothetical protein
MSQPSSGATVDVQVKNKTGSTADHVSQPDNSIASSSSDRKAASRDTARVSTHTIITRSRAIYETNAASRIPEPWMETVTPGKFEPFQAAIFPIVNKIVSQPEYANHSFTKRWKSLKGIPSYPMAKNST